MNRLQSVLLMILSDVDTLLKDNGIPYFLDGGSALGAIRHKGFIPWDDDLDICILPDDYNKFVEICKTKLDKTKYTFIEAHKDWPLHFCKIKLNGTAIDEIDAFPCENQGIYIDIFNLDYANKSKTGKYLQFILGRILVACMLSQKPYSTDSFSKKAAINFSRLIFRNKRLYSWLVKQTRFRPKSNEYSAVWDRKRSNWKRYFSNKALFESSINVDFEGEKFPVCKGYDEYLTNLYGDYMKLPPVEKRVGLHIKSIDFGKY